MCSQAAPAVLAAHDLDGDYLIPGFVDTHTDNLERQVQPRSLARWPSRSAMVAHDAQCAAAGVTTVFDALCLGDLGFDKDRIRTFQDGVIDLDALNDAGLLKADHFLHLRCEVPAMDMLSLFDDVADHPLVRIVSLMDHSPGVGQYADLDFYRALRRRGGLDAEYVERRIKELQDQREQTRIPHRRALLARIAGRDIALASHDDRTPEEVAENAADGIRISEFPVTMEAAQAAKAARHGCHCRRTEHCPWRLAFRQRVCRRSAGDRRGRCIRIGLCAEQPCRGGIPLRATHWPAPGGGPGDRAPRAACGARRSRHAAPETARGPGARACP